MSWFRDSKRHSDAAKDGWVRRKSLSQRRLERKGYCNLPIYVTDHPVYYKPVKKSLMREHEKATNLCLARNKKARRQMIRTLERHPSLVREIKKRKHLYAVVYSSRQATEEDRGAYAQGWAFGFKDAPKSLEAFVRHPEIWDNEKDFMRALDMLPKNEREYWLSRKKDILFRTDSRRVYNRKLSNILARNLHHELRHTDPDQRKKMSGAYFARQSEKDARQHEQEMLKPDMDELDPKVRPVVKELYKKGIVTKYSCGGHTKDEKSFEVKGEKLDSEPYLVFQDYPEAKRAMRKAGFTVTAFDKDNQWATARAKVQDRDKVWRKAKKEISKI